MMWDSFVDESKNGTFLLKRGYMDYHSDRFDDCSLMVWDGSGRLVAVLPACKDGDTVYSHRGLTYGGWVVPLKHLDVTVMLDVWNAMTEWLKGIGVRHLVYKAIPHIYHSYPSEEDQYALFRNGARIVSTYVSSTIPLESPIIFNENARRGMKNALKNGVTVEKTDDFSAFWQILSQLLKEKYGTTPVHTLDEIRLLKGRFPENIKLYVAKCAGEVVAGTVMYYTGSVAHAQYIAASAKGKELKALPMLFDYIIKNECGCCRYFDFGTSNEDGGRYLNEGLVRQKCGMGGRAIVYNVYQVDF
ncbi:MAG: GNAT family N-acetyltransferase [Muribaculaceae bacterium]|nr:GNAT family N-acetyltransferase [Muribaculaceae bacterium]